MLLCMTCKGATFGRGAVCLHFLKEGFHIRFLRRCSAQIEFLENSTFLI